MNSSTTDLIIIGAGAGGLMAACSAAEAGLRCLLIERRHRPGLKLLLCGNNRCNISHAGSPESLVRAYGSPVGDFLRPALTNFSPVRLREWFAAAGLPTTLLKERIYPRSEKADDVLHCFTDILREREIPLLLNCPVRNLTRDADGFVVDCNGISLRAPRVILATGGISYPKTGSVGDGQRFAAELGMRVEPFRPGLVALEGMLAWQAALPSGREINLPNIALQLCVNGNVVETFSGNVLLDGLLLRGSAAFDAARCAARGNLDSFSVRLNLFPGLQPSALAQRLQAAWQKCRQLPAALNALGLEREFCQAVAPFLADLTGNAPALAAQLQDIDFGTVTPRPIKEAIVTVGGIALDEINPETLECKRCPGLYCIGEVMDIDGPTGGYNLHAAFATARLAVAAISGSRTLRPSRPQEERSRSERAPTPAAPAARPTSRGNKSAWGKILGRLHAAAARREERVNAVITSVVPRWYDVHAHLGDPRLAAEREVILDRCEAELGAVLVTAAGSTEWEVVTACARRPQIYGAVGVHPLYWRDWQSDSTTRLEGLLRHPPARSKLIAVGEIGLDYWSGREDVSEQTAILAEQLLIAQRLAVPVIIHNRKSWSDFFALLRELRLTRLRGICHSFSGSRETARQAFEHGLAFSFSGVCTSPRATRLHELIRYIPAEALFIESDAPDQAPWSRRGELNYPWHVQEVYQHVATLRQIDAMTLLDTVKVNWQKLFTPEPAKGESADVP